MVERVPRRTVAQQSRPLCGIGVRSGRETTARLCPSQPGDGLAILRADLDLRVPLHLDFAPDVPSCSAVALDEASITLYVEHLMAAFHAAGITDAVVELGGPEIPLLDGSALPWCRLMEEAGLRGLEGHVAPLIVTEEITVGEGSQTLTALPPERDGQALFRFELEYSHPLIGKEQARFELGGEEAFSERLAPARTFALAEEIEQARAAGVLRGGSEENCRVVYADRLSQEPTLPDEFARHKILDMVGDLYLLGRPVYGRFIGRRTGHRHNRDLLRRIAACAIV